MRNARRRVNRAAIFIGDGDHVHYLAMLRDEMQRAALGEPRFQAMLEQALYRQPALRSSDSA